MRKCISSVVSFATGPSRPRAGLLCRSGFSYLFVGLEVGKEVGAGVAEGLKVVYVVVVV